MSKLLFASEQHRAFYENCIQRTCSDSYHKSFFYLIGLTRETRAHVDNLFSFDENCIKMTGLRGGWQTSSTLKICRLAQNLWNGHTESKARADYTPYELFACSFAPYFMEAVKLRYPEYCRDIEKPKVVPLER